DAGTLERLAQTPKYKNERTTPAALAQRQEANKTLRATMDANLKSVHEAGIPVAMGTDAGNPLTLHGPSVYAEMEAMQAAGLSAADVLVTATRGAAMAMNRLEDLGTVEPGKIADLTIVEADPTQDIANFRRLRFVVRGGVVRSIDELKPVNH
ncbi:MAG: amidohydrolase family protein, partial [Acidobacteriota bacterium]|nr:amidohydrolase family protein [Acidobacteriota bacterium]